LNKIYEDGVIDSEEITKLIEWASTLSLICRSSVIRKIYEFAFQVVAFDSFKYEDLSDQKKVIWKKWVNDLYDESLSEDLEEEEFCTHFFSSVPLIISYLRDDITHKKMSDFDENMNIQVVLHHLLDLHAVHSIEIDGDDIEITKYYPPKPKKTRRSKVSQTV